MRLTAALDLAMITADMARELAIAQKVCIRPLLRRVEDRQTGTEDLVAIPCGSTRENVCPSCAHKARLLRMQQCAEGWHRTQEPDLSTRANADPPERQELDDDGEQESDRRTRSTLRRQDAPDLPRVPTEDRTVGRVFTTPDGREYRPSMFVTLTLGSYGSVTSTGAPRDPGSYDYRRAALDALHFPKLVDRFWQNLRRSAGYKVQYFAAVEPQRRLAPHLHAAIRGAIPRATLRQVVKATYLQLWWPPFDTPVYVDRLPVWDGHDYVDPATGETLPSWQQALDQLDTDPDATPAHLLRFGRQVDMAGIIAPSPDADRAVRYLTKYLTKAISDAHTPDGDPADPAYLRHVDRLHVELRFLPCTPTCANWLRYGIQPANAGPGLQPGHCDSPAHDRDNLGLGGRRVLVSRQWSGKTLTQHKADRATVVREALLSAGIIAPDTERMAADVTLPDGTPRFVWTDTNPDQATYARVLLASIAERHRWRAQYETAKAAAAVDNSFGNPARAP
ncbi:hypothetical protein GCM10009841_30840 [Microlunatus panaciterrae]|uniref:Replication initiation protein n=1 Tax=Microlunatus panaciterrae TaxID=400768 RepID=A0ABS2RFG3_9ACTN|nr:replication initiator [Microlunatus panaciterrae]MBM7797744.1 hypothetical protein [Microlunatus panaciterrae]